MSPSRRLATRSAPKWGYDERGRPPADIYPHHSPDRIRNTPQRPIPSGRRGLHAERHIKANRRVSPDRVPDARDLTVGAVHAL